MDIQPNEWISNREMNRRPSASLEEKYDPDISHIVGEKVRVNDPRLIQLVVQWKRKINLDPDGTATYNFVHNADFVRDLKKLFNVKD